MAGEVKLDEAAGATAPEELVEERPADYIDGAIVVVVPARAGTTMPVKGDAKREPRRAANSLLPWTIGPYYAEQTLEGPRTE